jgi:hypothetical protein
MDWDNDSSTNLPMGLVRDGDRFASYHLRSAARRRLHKGDVASRSRHPITITYATPRNDPDCRRRYDIGSDDLYSHILSLSQEYYPDSDDLSLDEGDSEHSARYPNATWRWLA